VIRSIVEIKLPILIQDSSRDRSKHFTMESRTLRYRTNVPFCNACFEKRDSDREVILILKLAYRTNLSGWKLFFSWNVSCAIIGKW